MPKAVLFDLDGTLANTLNDIATATNRAFADYGLPPRPVQDFKRYAGGGTQMMIELALGNDTPPCSSEELINAYRAYYRQCFLCTTKPYPGVFETVRKLCAGGVKLGVVTNKPRSFSLSIVNTLFPGLFGTVQGNRDNAADEPGGYPPKPDPALANAAATELNVKPNECLFVGDSDIDIYTAKNFGCPGVGALWGFRTAEELTAAGADMLISDPRELIGAVFGRGV